MNYQRLSSTPLRDSLGAIGDDKTLLRLDAVLHYVSYN